MAQENNLSEEQRLERLHIKFYRSQQLPNLLRKLSIFAGKTFAEPEILNVDETEHMHTLLKESPIGLASLSLHFPHEDFTLMRSLILSLRNEILTTNYFCLQSFDRKCYLKVDTSFVLNQIKQLVELDGDGFYIYNLQLTNGMWIDFNQSSWKSTHNTYELKIWGKDWINKVNAVYQTL